jgi:hypothetical protein
MSSTPPILEHASLEPASDHDAYRLSELDTGALCVGEDPHFFSEGVPANHQSVSQPVRLLFVPTLPW